MANPFDQFDSGGGNPFDQFDAPTSGGGVLRYADDVVRQIASGVTLGASDEFAAAADAATQLVLGRGSEAPAFGQRYDANLAAERERDRRFREQNPIAATSAELLGAILGVGTGIRFAPTLARYLGGGGGSLAARTGRSAVGGAGLGGASGFLHGEGGFDERLAGAGLGATVGAGIGGVIPPVAAGAGQVGRVIAESAPGRFIADRVVSPAVGAVARAADAVAPKARPTALSAAPPEGGPPVTADSIATRLSERASALASDTSAEGIARRGAIQRLLVRMERDDLTPEQFADELVRLGDDALFFMGGGPNVQTLAKTTARLPGRGMQVSEDALLAEKRSIGPRMMGDVERNVASDTRFYTAFERTAAKRAADAEKLFVAARQQPLAVSEDMRVMMEIPAIKQAMQAVEDDAAQFGQQLTPVEIAHRVKQKLADMADAAFASGRPVNKADMGKLADRWREALHRANPTLAKADAAYAQSSKVMEALDAGRNFLIGGTSERGTQNAADALAARFAQMSDPEKEAFRVGVASAIRQQVMKGPQGARAFAKQLDESGVLREKLAEIVGPVNAERIFNMAGREMRRARAVRRVEGGSDTAFNMAAMAEDGLPVLLQPNTGGIVSRLINAGLERWQEGARGNEAVRNELARILFSANPTERARILDELARAAATRGNRPITAGTIGAGSSGLPSIGGP